MSKKEIVVGRDSIYLRRAPNRSMEAANYNRLRTLLYFGEGAWRAYGKSYEEVIESIKENMSKMPPPIPKLEKIIVVDQIDLAVLRYKLLKRGFKPRDIARFSNSIYVYDADKNKRLREIVV